MTVLHTTHNFWPGFQIEIIRKFPAKAKKGGGQLHGMRLVQLGVGIGIGIGIGIGSL